MQNALLTFIATLIQHADHSVDVIEAQVKICILANDCVGREVYCGSSHLPCSKPVLCVLRSTPFSFLLNRSVRCDLRHMIDNVVS